MDCWGHFHLRQPSALIKPSSRLRRRLKLWERDPWASGKPYRHPQLEGEPVRGWAWRWQVWACHHGENPRFLRQMAVCQNLVPLVNIKIAGKWMSIPLKMVSIGIDPYPDPLEKEDLDIRMELSWARAVSFETRLLGATWWSLQEKCITPNRTDDGYIV